MDEEQGLASPIAGGIRAVRNTVSSSVFSGRRAPVQAQPDTITTNLLQQNSLSLNNVSGQLANISSQVSGLNGSLLAIKENLAVSDSLERQREAAKLSHCEEFINELPNKYDTVIGENGIRLSGGEKQRISIARAMLKKSQIILLDEATSSLDSETEQKIQSALDILTKNKTTVVIAHRLSTVLNSNKIFVVENGKILASGKHEELLNNSEQYKNFYDKQIRKE